MKCTTSCASEDVEGVVGERQLLRRGLLDVHTGMALSGGRDERLGGVDGRDGQRSRSSDEFGNECARTAADVQDSPRGPVSAKSQNSDASGIEYLPMNESYASAATSNIATIYARGPAAGSRQSAGAASIWDTPARWGVQVLRRPAVSRYAMHGVLALTARDSPIGLDPARLGSFDERREPANLPLVAFEPRGVDLPLEREVLLM